MENLENKLRKTRKGNRIYPLNENYFDNIDTEEKAYFLGFLYADGCNSIKKGSITLGLQEKDREILQTLSNLLQPTKPLHRYKNISGFSSKQGHYRLVIASRHISERLVELGCMGAKTMILEFPKEEQVPKRLLNHFVRGYFDGNGCVETRGASISSTLMFCTKLAEIVKKELNVNFYIRSRTTYPSSEMCLKCKSARIFLKWLYEKSTIHLQRKYEKYLKQLKYEHSLKKLRECCVKDCTTIQRSKNYCQYHYDQVRKNKKNFPLKDTTQWL